MKLKKTIITSMTLAAVSFIGCGKIENMRVNDNALRFTATIGNKAAPAPQSRVAGTQWASGDAIGIFMVHHDTYDSADSITNKKYSTPNGDGNFNANNGEGIYLSSADTGTVDFIAYYPYQDNLYPDTTLIIEIDTIQTDANQPTFDLMWAKANNSGKGYSRTSGDTVNLSFGHCLTKLTMNCKLDASMGISSMPDDASVVIKDLNTRNTFHLGTGMPGTAPDTPADITLRRLSAAPSSFDASFDAIVLPGNYAGGMLTLECRINGKAFTRDIDLDLLEAGNNYIYDITIARSGISVKGKIKDWNDVTRGDLTAK